MSQRIPFTERKTPWRGLLDLATGRYPAYLFGGELGAWLPAFHFHDVTREYLAPYLQHLAENGYRTITSEAIAQFVRQGIHPGPRSVALCFDDAWASLSTVAAPLLKQYGLQAITYVSPARIAEQPEPGNPFATWPDLKALHASGGVDIQAHSNRHAMVFCAPEITGFVQPGFQRDVHSYPLIHEEGRPRFLSPRDLGAPLYLQRSRLSDARAYDHPAAREACCRHVQAQGGAAFFEQPGWEQVLRDIAKQAGEGRQETAAERDDAILEELRAAREILGGQLRMDVRHMCFPWAICGKAAEHAVQKAGYETAFADRLFGARAVRAGDNPYRLMRLRHEYIFCLPGRPRRTFFSAKNAPATPPGAASSGAPRICLLTGSFYPVVGGGETHARLLAGELHKRGAGVFVLTRRRLRESPVQERLDGFRVLRVPPSGFARWGKYLMLPFAYRQLIRHREEYDLIYVCGLRVLGLAGQLAARRLHKPCVLRAESCGELSGDFIWNSPAPVRTGLLKAFLRHLIAWRNRFYRQADAFISISRVIDEEFAACGIPEERRVLIHNAFDASAFQPATEEEKAVLRKKLGLPQGPLFAYSGKLNHGKGLLFLASVWKIFSARHPEAHLLLIGSGKNQFLSCEKELRAFVEREGLQNSMHFTGYVHPVTDHLRAADFFVFPTENEALGIALLEALACGLPSLASRVGGIPDIVEDGVSGRLAPVGDLEAWLRGLEELLARGETVRRWPQQGLETVRKKFSPDRVVEEHLKLFARVCAKTAPP